MNVGNLPGMALLNLGDLLSSLDVVLCDLARLVSGENVIGERGEQGDSGLGAKVGDVDLGGRGGGFW